MSPWKAAILGGYATGAALTFGLVMGLTMLGGNDADLWRPFVYAVFWPIAIPWMLFG